MAFLDEAGLEALWDDVVEFVAEEAVPPMSPTIRGGAKLDEHGGLVLRDEKLGIGSLVQESDGAVRGSIAGLTAEGHAEQFSTTGKNLLPKRSSNPYPDNLTINNDGSITCKAKPSTTRSFSLGSVSLVSGSTYTLSGGVSDNMRLYVTVGGVVKINSGNPVTFSVAEAETTNAYLVMTAAVNIGDIVYPQLELGSEATDYEPYTGGAPSPSPDYPQEIQVVRGRNLLDFNNFADGKSKTTAGGITYAVMSDGGIHVYGTSTSNDTYFNIANPSSMLQLTAGETYTLSKNGGTGMDLVKVALAKRTGSTSTYLFALETTYSKAFTAESVDGYTCYLQVTSGKTVDVIIYPQLTLGSTPQPYVPYGHVGIEVRDPDTDELISCTPIPLPSRGWVGSLPDGTADVLALDGAGKVEWELKDAETTTAATDGVTGTVGVDVLSTTGQIADGATVLYKLTTPVTEDCGYCEDWPTDIPEGATVTIPELDEVGISYFVDSAVTELAKQWYARANSEYADRLTALEQAVAELATS